MFIASVIPLATENIAILIKLKIIKIYDSLKLVLQGRNILVSMRRRDDPLNIPNVHCNAQYATRQRASACWEFIAIELRYWDNGILQPRLIHPRLGISIISAVAVHRLVPDLIVVGCIQYKAPLVSTDLVDHNEMPCPRIC